MTIIKLLMSVVFLTLWFGTTQMFKKYTSATCVLVGWFFGTLGFILLLDALLSAL